MSRDWESIFSTWSQGPSKTEQERAENAERQVYQAIRDSDELRHRDIKVFTQGSYRNGVNVRQESDVDVGVLCFDSYFSEYEDDNVKAAVRKSWEPATYVYSQFKDDLERAIIRRFGSNSVNRGDKSIKIDENTYRVKADVSAFFEHRRYVSVSRHLSGVQMLADSGKSVINWPEQHHENGVSKNTNTNRRYKRCVRILKSLRNEMANNGVAAAEPIPSFLIECLVWNAPNKCFEFSNYKSMVRSILVHIFNNTIKIADCSEWGEVSELKYLFSQAQPWSTEQAHSFLSSAWDYVGFE